MLKRKLTVIIVLAMCLAIAAMSCTRETTTLVTEEAAPSNCFTCHDDQDTFLIAAEQQWLNSFHASGLNINRGSSTSCAGCHISEGFVQRSKGEAVTSELNPTVIHCFTCHQPHTSSNFGLRWNTDATLEDGTTWDLGAANICAACHIARRDVNTYVGSGSDAVSITSTHWGPHHSVQADNLLGGNGYMYSGFTYEITEHRTATDDGCLDCHYKATSNNVVGGHSFNMSGAARDEGGEFEDLLNTATCEPCHGDLDDFDYNGVQTELDSLGTYLEGLVEAAGLWTNGHPNSGTTTIADSAGAVWNLLMYEEDRSKGVHNAKHLRGLLQSAIDYMEGNLPQPVSPWAEPVAGREESREAEANTLPR